METILKNRLNGIFIITAIILAWAISAMFSLDHTPAPVCDVPIEPNSG